MASKKDYLLAAHLNGEKASRKRIRRQSQDPRDSFEAERIDTEHDKEPIGSPTTSAHVTGSVEEHSPLGQASSPSGVLGGQQREGPLKPKSGRKRAVTACQFCRVRKTKCDNKKPTCGFCRINRVHCVYSDEKEAYQIPEPTNHELLDRINYIASRFDAYLDSAYHQGPVPRDQNHRSPLNSTPQAEVNFNDQYDGVEKSNVPAAAISSESVLKWPVLREIFEIDVESLLLSPQWTHTESTPLTPVVSSGNAYSANTEIRGTIVEDDIPALCNKFIALIHIRNPILDITRFKKTVRSIAANGLAWDSQSCLVLLACALAWMASPSHMSGNKVETNARFLETHMSREAAEAYFIAAKKRLGLLEVTIESVQCLMLAGIFEMYCLRALKAWLYFQQACTQLQTIIWNNSKASRANEICSTNRWVESRLYWSCVKVECELRGEAELPPSGILTLNYSDPFPTPPVEIYEETVASVMTQNTTDSHNPTFPSLSKEQGWLYYLAEISLRKTANRILRALYSNGPQSWISDIRKVLKESMELEHQVMEWQDHVPVQIRWSNDDDEIPANEFSFYLKGRTLCCLEWIHRPFLYYVLHQPRNDPYMSLVLPLAGKCLYYCTKCIPNLSLHPRHGGTWYSVRKLFTCGLLIMAAVKSNMLTPPADWESLVLTCIGVIAKWEDEAEDLRQAKTILQKIYEQGCRTFGNDL